MLKKFVPLNASASPSQNPYEVRTYIGDTTKIPEWNVELCNRQRICQTPGNSTISKVMTIEDELRRLHQKAKQSRFQRPFKKKCMDTDIFTMCVIPQRTPHDLKVHAVARERYLYTQDMLNTRVHDATEVGAPPKLPSLIRLNSPMQMDEEEEQQEESSESEEGEEEGEEGDKPVKPQLASPPCSVDVIFVPPKKLLQLKRPKSGMFHNETEPPLLVDDGVPYHIFNPRVQQDKFDAQGLERIDIITGKDPNDLWTWNIGVQKRESELDHAYVEAAIPKLDCNNMELTIYKIPKDLDKTFTAEIVFGNSAIAPLHLKKKPFYYRPNEIACIFIAFVESFRLNPDFWTAETMDSIFASATKLLKKSTDLFYKSKEIDFDILTQIVEKSAVIDFKVHFTGPLKNEPNIYKALSLYFSKFNAAVLVSTNLYLLMWKRCKDSYYVFDPNGRNELCQRDFEEGKCSLMATRTVEHLVHLIVNFSQANMEDEFNLYEIVLVNYGKMVHPPPSKPFPKRTRRLWAVVNNTYAIIPAANNGLQQPNTGNERNPSMVISLIALLYADIERPSLWRMDVVDELIKFSKIYYKVLTKRMKMKKNQHYNIVDLPTGFMLGAFRAMLKKRPFLFTGHVADCKSYLDSQLIMAVKDLFMGKWEAGLLQIDNCIVSIWRDREYFYLFDPFRRGKAGQVLDPEDFLTKGVACLQMHTNFDSFCRILYQKALKMRRGGKFFLHGIIVGCIKSIPSALGAKNKFKFLKLHPPKYTDEPELDKPEGLEKKKAKGKAKSKPRKGKADRKHSIHSIPEEDRIPEYEETDVVIDVLEEIICEILHSLVEPSANLGQLYKQADKVLLRSDKAYLEALKYRLKHGEDFDNIYSAVRTKPPEPQQPMTLEEELLVPSNYEMLPDGTWVVFGATQLPVLDDEMSKLAGLLAVLVTAALTAKYKISTWNVDLIEYALEATNNFSEQFQNYQGLLAVIISNKLPKISIGQDIYMLKVEKIINSDLTHSLRQVLLGSLMSFNRLLVICQHFSCVITKRYNFLYMFIGFPCNSVGYRKFGTGPGCMLRFVELDSLIRRIEFGCNPQGCEVTNYVIVCLHVMDVTTEPPARFREWPTSEQQQMYEAALAKQRKIQQRKMDKIHFLDEELRKENERIQNFLEEKRSRIQRRLERKRSKRSRAYDSEVSYYDGYEEGEDEFEEAESLLEEEEEEIELKHKPGKKLKREIVSKFKPRPILYGYQMREKDCLFKIQGSTAVEGREEATLAEIKPCFFVSTLAILYAILRPLNQWNSQRIDRVVENGQAIASKVTNMTTAFERIIKNITVDDYEFDVLARTYEPTGVWAAAVEHKIAKATQSRRYLLLQTANSTYAIFRDEYYHLFDPYGSMVIMQEEEEEGEDEEEEEPKKCPKGLKRYGERNTASWVLFADVETMLTYIDKRVTNVDWRDKNQFQLHVVDVISYKKAASKAVILQLLTDLSVPMACTVTQHGEDESFICAHNENINWLELENCLPVWSRMNRRNTAGRYRNLPVTKMKKYDIEIEGRLWSLWGNLHPMAPVFDAECRGKQYLACNVIACCATMVYSLTEWSPQLLDTIVISGDRYHRESLANIKQKDYEFSLEDLNLECTLENIRFVVHLEHVAYGKLYCTPTYSRMNMAEALMYFFSYFEFGVLQCQKRSLAIGRTMGHDGGYFMYDCQNRDYPLFPKGQGASYVLRTKHLQVLLYCIVVTLNVPHYNVTFTLHKVDMLREGALVEEEGEEEEEATPAN